jgi:hypothetical protein
MVNNEKSWTVAFWVMSVLAVASFGWTTFCYFNNGDKINDLAKVANHSLTSINESMSSINLRLSKIEWKLEITK